MENILTFDLENWYDSEFISPKCGNDFVLVGLERVTKILKKHNVKATFFVTGNVLEKYPDAVRKLHDDGHEIASHSYEHKMLSKMKRADIESNLLRSKKLIRKIIGENPKGFRAPSWSISKKEFWVYDYLERNEFQYSSSLFPKNMGLYGSSEFPLNAFKPIRQKKFIEFPMTLFEFFGIRIPFSGGFYFRFLPTVFIKRMIRSMNKRGRKVVLYIHPWELCDEIPRVRTSFAGKIITYWGLKKNSAKLDSVLSEFQFVPFSEVLHNE